MLSYYHGFVVSFVCIPSLLLIVMKDLKVPELIPLILAVLLAIGGPVSCCHNLFDTHGLRPITMDVFCRGSHPLCPIRRSRHS